MSITITLARESLDDGSPGYTVALGDLSMLAGSEDATRDLADAICERIRTHTGEDVRVNSTIEARN